LRGEDRIEESYECVEDFALILYSEKFYWIESATKENFKTGSQMLFATGTEKCGDNRRTRREATAFNLGHSLIQVSAVASSVGVLIWKLLSPGIFNVSVLDWKESKL